MNQDLNPGSVDLPNALHGCSHATSFPPAPPTPTSKLRVLTSCWWSHWVSLENEGLPFPNTPQPPPQTYFVSLWDQAGPISVCCALLHGTSQCSGEGNGTPLQYSCLENPMDGGAWKAAVHGVAKSRIWLSDCTFTFHFHALEKEMATHSSILAWRIPGTGEPGGLPSMGSHKVGHDWSDFEAAAAASAETGPGS